jgi:hypothetical protein
VPRIRARDVFASRNSAARLVFQGPQRNRIIVARNKKRVCSQLRVCLCSNFSQTKLRQKTFSESQTTPIQPKSNTSKDEETKMAKKVRKAAKKAAPKARKARKARKTVRKARKSVRKAAKKPARKAVRKAAKRKPARRRKMAKPAAL